MRTNQKWPDHGLFFGPKVPHKGGSAVAQKIKGRASKVSFLSQKVSKKMWRYFLDNVKNAPESAFFRSRSRGSRGSGNLETVKNFRRRPMGKLFGTKSWWKQVSTEIRKNQKWPNHEPFFGPGGLGAKGVW